MKKKWLMLSLMALFFVSNVNAIDHMRLRIKTHLPEEIKTVGEAARYYAKIAGYELVTEFPAPVESSRITMEVIHPSLRVDTVMAVEDAILKILDKKYRMVVDKKNKLFSFEEVRIR